MAGEVKVSASSFDYLLLGIVSCTMEGGTSMTNASLEAIGVRIGEKLVERATRPMPRGDKSEDKSGSSPERGRFISHVDAIRFVCREVWKLATRKSADGLSITKRGAWLVCDNTFNWLAHVSKPLNSTGSVEFSPLGKLQKPGVSASPAPQKSDVVGPVAATAAAATASTSQPTASANADKKDTLSQQDVNAPYLALFMGVIKGAMANLGIPTTVTASVSGQAVTFTIKGPAVSDGTDSTGRS